jgi:hypothetical protein
VAVPHSDGVKRGPNGSAPSIEEGKRAGVTVAGLSAILIETRHVKAALKAMTVKTDRNDARGMAQLMRMGWSVRCTSKRCRRKRSGRC